MGRITTPTHRIEFSRVSNAQGAPIDLPPIEGIPPSEVRHPVPTFQDGELDREPERE